MTQYTTAKTKTKVTMSLVIRPRIWLLRVTVVEGSCVVVIACIVCLWVYKAYQKYCYDNTISIKTLQRGKSRNIRVGLQMTAGRYNWVLIVYCVGAKQHITWLIGTNVITKNQYQPQSAQQSTLEKMTPRNFLTGVIDTYHITIQDKEDYFTLWFLLGIMGAGIFPNLQNRCVAYLETKTMGSRSYECLHLETVSV